MLTYARSKDSTVTQSNYFTVASRRLLGTEQAVQFQSGNQYGSGWHWGSKCTADNVCNESSASNNALAEMPREYLSSTASYGGYYNFYAATAGSGTYSTGSNSADNTSSQAADSICPSGWQLPWDYDYAAGRSKSYYNLLISGYNLTVHVGDGTTETSDVKTVRRSPLEFYLSGYYDWSSGGFSGINYGGLFWSRTASTNRNARYLNYNLRGRLDPQNGNDKIFGLSVRCVKK